MSSNIIITPFISFDVTIIFHSEGREQDVQLEEIVDISVNPKTGKTMLTYYTGNPDCEHDSRKCLNMVALKIQKLRAICERY